MTPLTLLLIVKIAVTFVAVALPFLFFSRQRIDAILAIETETPMLYRLYGVAIVALLVGYGGGLVEVFNCDYPTGVIAMGLTSNIGATLVLLITGSTARNQFMTLFFASISIGLAIAALFPTFIMNPIF